MSERQSICVYSVGERFVGPNFEGLPLKKQADNTLVVNIDARKLSDPADETGQAKQIPLIPGYDPNVRNKIISNLPEDWLNGVWENQVQPKLKEFMGKPEKYQYLQIMVICGAGYQRSPAIASTLYEILCAHILEHGIKLPFIKCFHLSAELAHWIKTEVGLR